MSVVSASFRLAATPLLKKEEAKVSKREDELRSRLVAALIASDNNRARSKQTAIGVSELGGCRAKVWLKIQGHEGTNPTKRLAAIMGTAIHKAIEEAFADSGAKIEMRIEAADGLPPATIDFYEAGEIVDWKTIKLSGIDYFPSKQQRWQVQTYGYLAAKQGLEVKNVNLVGIPRDGNEDDIVVHSEPYDESIALAAFEWLREIEAMTEQPAPEREPVSFCSSYCEFYGQLCNGISKDLSGAPIFDDAAIQAAKDYKAAIEAEKQAKAAKDSAKAALEGYAGITLDGIKVSWSEIAGRQTPDTEAIQKLLGAEPIPMKQGEPSIRLTVK